MRAVNLMPETGRSGVASAGSLLTPANGVIAALLLVLGLVALYVVSSNQVSSRRTKLAAVQQQAATVQSQANQLSNYVSYQKLAEQRVETIRQLAGGRFDWHHALSNLARVVPANAAFQSLLATASTGSSVAGAGGSVGGGAGTGGLRSDIASPAFEVKGCSDSQVDVARLLSRLRAMPGVDRVTLADSVIGTASTSSSNSSSGQLPTACGRHPANFDLVIFFTARPGSATAAAGTGPTGAATTTATTSTVTSTSTTATASAQPVSNGSGG